MRPRLLAASLAAFAFVLCCLLPSGAAAQSGDATCSGADTTITTGNIAESERSLHCIVNQYRAANGLAPLVEEPALARAARNHSDYMETTNQFAHSGIGDGAPIDRARAAGFVCDYNCVGENLAYSGFPEISPRDMFEQWKASPGHNANMLDADYLSAGMGFAVGGNHGVTGTQVFAVVTNGATGTAKDMLTSAACDNARSGLAAAEAKVEKAKAKVKKAKSKERKRKARKKLRKAKGAVKDQSVAVSSSCNLSF